MTVTSTDKNGVVIFWNDNEKQWEYESGKMCVNGKEICERCNKPRLDINGVVDCDFCLQGLTVCDFIDYACCGHGDDEQAYISLKDGRRFVLDKIGDENTNNEVLLEYFKLKEEYNELKEVNEWLKKSIKRQQSSNEECSKYIEEVVKENEQLKSAYMEMEDYLGRLEEQIIEVRKNDGL